MCLALGPQRSDAGEARTCGPSVSGQALYYWATALPYMLWALKRTISMRWFFWIPNQIFKLTEKALFTFFSSNVFGYLLFHKSLQDSSCSFPAQALSFSCTQMGFLLVFFLISQQNICCGYSKEPSQWDGSLEYPEQMFKLTFKTIFIILHCFCVI